MRELLNDRSRIPTMLELKRGAQVGPAAPFFEPEP